MLDRIEFIADYCDRWCERCPFTERCSAYAVRVATGMCGDLRDGIELALQPQASPPIGRLAQSDDNYASTALASSSPARECDREVGIGRLPASRLTRIFVDRATRWLAGHATSLLDSGDVMLAEAVQTVAWDAPLIAAKLHRARQGRDAGDDDCPEDVVQSDWNGSAKVALISLERSEAAWQVIAAASPDRESSSLVMLVSLLRRRVLREFPDAVAFVRPGFDEPWISR